MPGKRWPQQLRHVDPPCAYTKRHSESPRVGKEETIVPKPLVLGGIVIASPLSLGVRDPGIAELRSIRVV